MRKKKTLDELSTEALAVGMSYGQYVAMLEASNGSKNIPQNNDSPGVTAGAERSKGGRTTGKNN